MKFFLLLSLFAPAALTAQDRHVVVISIDGFPAYAFEDPKLPVPTLRQLAAAGAVARGMSPINPSVTWPNHTAMVTGVNAAGHQVLFNGTLVRKTPTAPPRVEPWVDKAEMVRAPTIYDIAYRAGLTTAQVDWVAIQNPGTITWAFGERPTIHDGVVQEMIKAGELTEPEVLEFQNRGGAWRDQVWTRAIQFITKNHKPNLGLYHLLNLDAIHHTYGPRTAAGLTAIALADSRVKEIVEAVRASGTFDNTTFLIVSDHGFKGVTKQIRASLAAKGAGIDGVTVVPEGGSALVYIHDPAARAQSTPRLKEVFGRTEGVKRVYLPSEYGELGLPVPGQSDQAPDLVLAAADTYAFAGGGEGTVIRDLVQGGTHGYVSPDPEMNALFIAFGRGIRRGVKIDVIQSIDIAPTIAALLGLKMEGVQGRPLSAILE